MVLIIGVIVAAFTHYIFGGLQFQARARRTTSAARLHLSILLAAIVLVRAASYWLERYSLTTKSTDLMTGIQYTDANAVLPTKAILAIALDHVRADVPLGHLDQVLAAADRRCRPAARRLGRGGRHLPGADPVPAGQAQREVLRERRTSRTTSTRPATRFGLSNVDTKLYNAATDGYPGPATQRHDDGAGHPHPRPQRRLGHLQAAPGGQVLLPVPRHPRRRPLQRRRQGRATPSSRCASSTSTACPTASATGSTTTPSTPTATASSRPTATSKDADGKPVFFEQNIPSTGAARRLRAADLLRRAVAGLLHRRRDRGSVAARVRLPRRHAGRPGEHDVHRPGRRRRSGRSRVKVAVRHQVPRAELPALRRGQRRLAAARPPRRRVERVQRVAPWLTLDGNAYPAVVDGRVQWIVDGYTTTADYPNSRRSTSIDQATSDSVTDDAHPVHGRRGGPGQLHPQLGQGHRRRLRRHGPPLRLGRLGPDAQGVDEGLPRHRAADVGHQRRPDGAPALPRGPVQGAARDPRHATT